MNIIVIEEDQAENVEETSKCATPECFHLVGETSRFIVNVDKNVLATSYPLSQTFNWKGFIVATSETSSKCLLCPSNDNNIAISKGNLWGAKKHIISQHSFLCDFTTLNKYAPKAVKEIELE